MLLGTWLEGRPGKCFTTMPALVQHLKFKALEGCGSESSQLTHYRASKSFPSRESIQPAQCVFMPSALSMRQLLCPNFPFPVVTPDSSHSGSGHIHPIDLILHLQGPYFQIKSHQEELGVRISPTRIWVTAKTQSLLSQGGRGK